VAALTALLRNPGTLRRLALASLIANIGIVVTGGAVRLTGSGLGCPTWPRCSNGSYTTTPALGIHGVVEFSNRTLSFVLGLLALLVVVSVALQAERGTRLTISSVTVLASIPAQAVVGGITVLTKLNPWVVSCHFLFSIVVITAAYIAWRETTRTAGDPAPVSPATLRLHRLVLPAAALTIAVGAIVTASGPHAGDAHARRTGLDPAVVSRVHSALVLILVCLTIAVWRSARNTHPGAGRAALVLLCVEAAQGVVGVVQSLTNLPGVLVGVHMLGSCLVWVAALALRDELHGPAVASSDLNLTPATTP